MTSQHSSKTERPAGAHSRMVDTVARESTAALAAELLGDGGDYCMVGAPKTQSLPDIPTIWSKDIQVNSGWEMPLPRYGRFAYGRSTEANLQRAFAWLASGSLQSEPLITSRIAPQQFAEAFKAMKAKPEETMGIMVKWK